MHTHSNQWGIMDLSPRVSVYRSRRQHSRQGSCQHLARKDCWSQVGSRAGKVLSPAGQSTQQPMAREISMTWSSTLLCGAQLFLQWFGQPASVIPWKCCTPPFWVFLINVLAPLRPSGDFPQEPVGGPWLSSWHPFWQVGNFPRSLSMGSPALHAWLFWPCVQVS